MVKIIIFFSHKPKSSLEISYTCHYKEEFDQKNDSCELIMDNGGQTSVPTLAPISHQNHASIDPNQGEFFKNFYGNARLDPDKVHPSLLRIL